MTKLLVQDAGLPTPRFALVEQLSDVAAVDLAYPLFTKPVAEGTGKGITAASKVLDAEQLLSNCRDLLQRFRQPVLVEEFRPAASSRSACWALGRPPGVVGTMEILFLALMPTPKCTPTPTRSTAKTASTTAMLNRPTTR